MTMNYERRNAVNRTRELLADMGWGQGDVLIWEETLVCEDTGEYPGYVLRKKEVEG